MTSDAVREAQDVQQFACRSCSTRSSELVRSCQYVGLRIVRDELFDLLGDAVVVLEVRRRRSGGCGKLCSSGTLPVASMLGDVRRPSTRLRVLVVVADVVGVAEVHDRSPDRRLSFAAHACRTRSPSDSPCSGRRAASAPWCAVGLLVFRHAGRIQTPLRARQALPRYFFRLACAMPLNSCIQNLS